MNNSRYRLAGALLAVPLVFALPSLFGWLTTGSVYRYSGLAYEMDLPFVSGLPAIDPNDGITSETLGVRAAKDIITGQLPLWNHYEGFGTPLLGEMQSAALFPFTWLQLLPHGQILEFAALQFIAGVGTYLFLRNAQVVRFAALTGALLFQLNGVFAWLKNAVYNPVAFLPWLILSIELAYRSAGSGHSLKQRFPSLTLGGAASALSVYAGFPEEVYLYAFVLLLWAGLRFFELKYWARGAFVLNLGLMAVFGLLISLPALLAFTAFLPEATLGNHAQNGFYGMYLPTAAVLQYFLPYVYGPIFCTSIKEVPWGAIGGYIGVMPAILAVVALQLPERRVIKAALAAWIVVAISVSHGAPGVYESFMQLPLMKITATFRYLNAGWIFCFVILAGLGLDELIRQDSITIRRVLLVGAACGCAAVIASVVLSWAVLSQSFSESVVGKVSAGCSIIVFGCILAALFLVSGVKDKNRVVSTLSLLTAMEAALYFVIPYLSYQTGGKLDLDLVEFLKNEAGFQRVVATDGGQLSPNYGSYFGFSQLNWNDGMFPREASSYVQRRLDPYLLLNGIVFAPEPAGLNGEQKADRQRLFSQRLTDYARAGVKFVLSSENPAYHPVGSLGPAWRHPVLLEAGQRMELAVSFPQGDLIAGLSVLIGTHGGQSDGEMRVVLCRGNDCAAGTTNLGTALDNSPAVVRFDHSVVVHPGEDVSVILEKLGGSRGVSVWTGPLTSGQKDIRIADGPPSVRPLSAPILQVVGTDANSAKLVHRGHNTKVFELSEVRPYFDSPECKLTPITRDSVQADCPTAGRLVRLELAMPGWRVSVDNRESPVRTVDDIFQEIDLPAGKSVVRFVYAPMGVRAAVWVAAGSVMIMLSALAWCAFPERSHGPSYFSAQN